MKNNRKNLSPNDDYNYVVTIVLIIVLIIIRISINTYSKQNLVIAWINFLSISYVLWRIYFKVNLFLKYRKNKSQVLESQYKLFNQFSLIIFTLLLLFMIIYSILLKCFTTFYPYGSCINDILSLCALLFSIEDEKIINKLIAHYRLVV